MREQRHSLNETSFLRMIIACKKLKIRDIILNRFCLVFIDYCLEIIEKMYNNILVQSSNI